jgi:hypothetical protein
VASDTVALGETVLSSAVHGNSFITGSFRKLRSLFETSTSPGPVGYARTIQGDAARLEQVRLYANGIMLEFLYAIERQQ